MRCGVWRPCLPRDAAVAEAVAARLRLSNKAEKRPRAARLAETLAVSPEALAYRLGTDCAVDRLLLAGQKRGRGGSSQWKPPRLPIGGGALIARGLCRKDRSSPRP